MQWVHERAAESSFQIERIGFWDPDVKYVWFDTWRCENINLKIFIDVLGIFSISEKVFDWKKSDEDASWNVWKDLLPVRWRNSLNHLNLVLKTSFLDNLLKIKLKRHYWRHNNKKGGVDCFSAVLLFVLVHGFWWTELSSVTPLSPEPKLLFPVFVHFV